MTDSRIHLRKADLHYPMTLFQNRSLKTLLARLFHLRPAAPMVHDVHALRSLSVDIGSGERIGLLGPNGAGKTSFLKTVAGLYPLSGGEMSVTGEVRALFDLSLGFEPDATGRENILYRGLLMGLSPRFMREHEAVIVNFADLDEFIDYPLRTYSAGMQLRLAFAISTSVGGDILLLDEVIGAGDAAFMEKAKRRIAELVAHADILILASHDMQALRQLCRRGLVFGRGQIVFDGPIDQAIAHHLNEQGVQPCLV